MISVLNYAKNVGGRKIQDLCSHIWYANQKVFNTTVTSVTDQSGSKETATTPDEEPDDLYKLVEVELKGSEPAVMKSYCWFATTAATELNIKLGNCWKLPKPIHSRRTLLKSAFVHKKHRVQYEVRTHYHFMQFLEMTGSTANTFLEYIQRNLPEGMAMKVSRVAIQKLPEHLLPPKPSS